MDADVTVIAEGVILDLQTVWVGDPWRDRHSLFPLKGMRATEGVTGASRLL